MQGDLEYTEFLHKNAKLLNDLHDELKEAAEKYHERTCKNKDKDLDSQKKCATHFVDTFYTDVALVATLMKGKSN